VPGIRILHGFCRDEEGLQNLGYVLKREIRWKKLLFSRYVYKVGSFKEEERREYVSF
jgi:hypothetical protein